MTDRSQVFVRNTEIFIVLRIEDDPKPLCLAYKAVRSEKIRRGAHDGRSCSDSEGHDGQLGRLLIVPVSAASGSSAVSLVRHRTLHEADGALRFFRYFTQLDNFTRVHCNLLQLCRYGLDMCSPGSASNMRQRLGACQCPMRDSFDIDMCRIVTQDSRSGSLRGIFF